ncbi:MAG: oligosaccharide flippase family protein [Gammaproteobacteria bacterium]
MNVARRLTANMAFAVGGRVISALIGLAITGLVTRHLGAELFGIYRTASAWAVLGCTLANLGLSVVCLREISRPGADITRIIGTALTLRFITAALSIVVLTVVFMQVPLAHMGDPLRLAHAVTIAGIGTMATLGNELVVTIFQSALAQRRATIAELSGGAVTLVLTLVVIYMGGSLLGLMGAATGGLIMTLLISVVLAESIAPVRPRLDIALAGSLLVLGIPLFMSDIVGMVTLRLDTVALSLFSTPTEVGYYGVANKLREVAVKLPYMFAAFLMPLLVRSMGDLREFNLRLSNSLVAVWVFAVSVMLAMGCFGDVILHLLAGRGFAESTSVVQITGIALAAGSLSAVLQMGVLARDRAGQVLNAHIISAVVAIAGYYLLIPRWGAAGTAWAVAAGESAFMLRLLWIASPDGISALPWRKLLGVGLVGGFSAALLLGLRARGVGLAWALSAAVVLYPLLLLGAGVASRQQLMSLVGRSGPKDPNVS